MLMLLLMLIFPLLLLLVLLTVNICVLRTIVAWLLLLLLTAIVLLLTLLTAIVLIIVILICEAFKTGSANHALVVAYCIQLVTFQRFELIEVAQEIDDRCIENIAQTDQHVQGCKAE